RSLYGTARCRCPVVEGIDGWGDNRDMPLLSLERDVSCSTGSPWKLKPWRTVLKDKDHGWSPLLWIVYLGFFFVDPVMSHASTRIWFYDFLGVAAFLALYLGLFWLENPKGLVHIGGMVALGMLFQPINGGACSFFIYAAAMLPFCVETQKAGVIGLAIIGAIAAVQSVLLHLNVWRL